MPVPAHDVPQGSWQARDGPSQMDLYAPAVVWRYLAVGSADALMRRTLSSVGHHGKMADMNKLILTIMAMALLVCPTLSKAVGNERIASYEDAKKILYKKVYYDHRKTLYCGANFDKKRNVELPRGFRTPEHEKRSHKVEIEHIVPAENFGLPSQSGGTELLNV